MLLRILYLLAFPLIVCNGYSRLTNIKCDVFDPTKFNVSICKLKVLGRGIVAANLHLNVNQPPDKDWKIVYSIFRKQNVYHPFLYNITLDFCRYMKKPSRLQIFYIFHQAFLPFSNLNHTCPYNHDIIVKDFVLDDKMLDLTPMPKGSYMYSLTIISSSVWAATLRFYMDLDVKQSFRNRDVG